MSNRHGWKTLFLRRRFIVDRQLQISMILRIGGYAVFMLFVLIIGLLVPLILEMQYEGADEVAHFEAANVLLYVHSNLWPVALLCMVLIVLGALHLSHGIAGPLVPFKRSLAVLARGEQPKVVITRQGDYLKNEVALLNRATESLAQRMAEIRAADRALHEAIDAMTGLTGETSREAVAAAIARVREQAVLLHQRIDCMLPLENADKGDQPAIQPPNAQVADLCGAGADQR